MAETTKIEWTHHTFNPWRSCEHARLPDGSEHPGCANCYAEAMSRRNPKVLGVWGPQGTRVVAAESQWKAVERWNREAGEKANAMAVITEALGERRAIFPRPRVFVASLADVFEDWDGPMSNAKGETLYRDPTFEQAREIARKLMRGAPPSESDLTPLTMADVRARLFRLIDSCRHIDFLLVTKRPENVRKFWPRYGLPDKEVLRPLGRFEYRKNVWLLTSVSDQQTADAMIPELLKCRDLVPVLGISAEPLLGAIDLHSAFCREYGDCPKCPACLGTLDWVIVGGESGPGARPCRVEWIRSIVDQCRRAEVPVFVKQLGAFPYGCMSDQPRKFNHGSERLPHGTMPENESRLIVSDPKGGDPLEWPEDLRVRQFPEVKRAYR